MIRIKDIAREANVSTATVSYVLNENGTVSEETRKKVLEVIAKLGYKPNPIAKSLKMKKTNTIGVVVEDITIFNAPYMIEGINGYLEKNGMNLILTNMSLHQRVGRDYNSSVFKRLAKKAIEELIEKRVDGLIYIGVHPRDITGMIPKLNVPIVYSYCYTTNPGDFSVSYDDEFAAYEATRYLIGKGHRRIALISGLIDSVPSHNRFQGYLRAMLENSLSFDPAYMKTGDWEVESGYEAAKNLLRLDSPPTALLALNDLMAVGAMRACEEAGLRIPGDISLIGFDNREFSAFLKPRLTTMDLPLLEMGERSAAKLLELLSQPAHEDTLSHMDKPRCRLIERESVAAIEEH